MDPRAAKTISKVKNTLLELLKNKKLSEITVSELCTKAGINRNTFYSHFKSPEGVFDDICKELFFEIFSLNESSFTRKDGLIAICKYMKEKQDVVGVLLLANAEDKYIHLAVSRVLDFTQRDGIISDGVDASQLEIANTYLIFGAMGVFKRWVENDMADDPVHVALTINTLMEQGLTGLFEQSK